MHTPTKEIIETRLHMWKLFFETGRDTLPGGATADTYDVDAVIDTAIESGDPDLIGLAELVDLMSLNYIFQMDDGMHAALMHDDPADSINYVHKTRASGSLTMAELDVALAGA